MSKRKRLKFGMIAFFTICGIAVLKNWLPGISETLVITGAVPVLSYILGDTFRPSKE